MAATNPCTPCCATTQTVDVPGVQGDAGGDGSDGQNAYTLTTLAFVVPAIGADVTVSVLSSLWMAIGQVLVVVGTFFRVVSNPTATSVMLENLGYTGGNPPGATINANSTLSPAGAPSIVQPCFAANLGGADQTAVVSTVPTQLIFASEVFDSHNNYDITTYRYTPTIAGVYQFTVTAEMKAMADGKTLTVFLRKNNVDVAAQKIVSPGIFSAQVSVNFRVQANGSTDYFTAWILHDATGNHDVDGANTKTFFQGNWVGVAS